MKKSNQKITKCNVTDEKKKDIITNL